VAVRNSVKGQWSRLLRLADRTPVPTHRRDANAWAILYLYDLNGQELWHQQMAEGEWCIATRLIDWFGPGQPECVLVYGFSVERQGPAKPACTYNGRGEIVSAGLACRAFPGDRRGEAGTGHDPGSNPKPNPGFRAQ
jgi:hypothetical protein